MSNTNTAAAAIEANAEAFANWLADTVEHKIAEGRTLGLSDDDIVAGTRSALLTFLAGR
jgi:hypothetical protein